MYLYLSKQWTNVYLTNISVHIAIMYKVSTKKTLAIY